ncbi:hypothetical protein GCM10028803_53270 [Larkinella knui]|uniref:Uncharacterized protein n=1 Tax=Larkinella knui TaxID=2025310 RepID=A0A3P1CGS9_9BACT|nr:hypothetical protein [Larkinella knui]RRB12467.1 hypothetical protein EHT87_19910 [Larkinella knui]
MAEFNNSISREIILNAKALAIKQSYLPMSPYHAQSSSKIDLCAAACLAYAGFDAVSKQESEAFILRLIQEGEEDTLLKAFEQLNWPTSLCEEMRADNDITPEAFRLSKFLRTCDSLIES